jgi:hypothetical protein
MLTLNLKVLYLLGSLALVGGLACAQPSSGKTLVSRHQTRDDSLPPLYIAGGRRNPEAPPPL